MTVDPTSGKPAMSRGGKFLRLLTGFVMAPLAPIAALAAIAIGSGDIDPAGTLPMFVLGAPVSYGAMLVFGVPAVAIARWRRWDSLWIYLSGSMLVGVTLAVIFAFSGPDLGSPGKVLARGASGLLPVVVGCSFLVGATFWLIVRPDRFGGPS